MNKKIQILRAIAIIAVVVIHTNTTGMPGAIIRTFVNFCVAMFLFCSGYLTKTEIDDWKGFYKKRLMRVVIPYVVWSVFYTVLYGNYDTFIRNIISANCCGVFYYIYVYIQLVILTPLIGKLIRSKFSWVGWAITPLSILVVRYILKFAGITLGFPFPRTIFIMWFIFYYLGMALGNDIIRFKLSRGWCALLFAGATALSIAETLIWYRAGDVEMAETQLRLSSMVLSCVTLLMAYRYLRSEKMVLKENIATKTLVLLGDYSFGIYIIHMAVIYALEKLNLWQCLPFPINTAVVIVASALLVFAGKCIFGKKLSRYLGL